MRAALVRAWSRPQGRFLILFSATLTVAFTVLSLKPVDQAVVTPYTGVVAEVAGAALRLVGEEASVDGLVLRSPRFQVAIYNGCNGLVTSLIFVCGVLSFPARWRDKALGLALGVLAIQLVNQVRIVSLFYIGVFAPSFFSQAHIYLWQSVVILFGVGLWVWWAARFGRVAANDDAG